MILDFFPCFQDSLIFSDSYAKFKIDFCGRSSKATMWSVSIILVSVVKDYSPIVKF